MLLKLTIATSAVAALAGIVLAAWQTPREPRLVLVRQHPTPVITTRSAGAEGNRFRVRGWPRRETGRHITSSRPRWWATRYGST